MKITSETPIAPRMPGNGAVLSSRMKTAAVSVDRITVDDPQSAVRLDVIPEDAFMVVYQLRDHPKHDFWTNGKYAPWGPALRSSLNIIHLADGPSARLVNPVDSLHFHIPRAALDEMADDAAAPRIAHLRAPQGWRTFDPVFSQMQGLIANAVRHPAAANRLLHDHLMFGLLAHVAQTYGGMQADRRPLGGLAPRQESRAKELLGASLCKEVSLTEIARQCGLSLAHFSRSFKQTTGTTPHGWLQTRRIVRAQDLMLTSRMALADIAVTCGFADQSHFTRHFVRAAGMTPGAWRRDRKHYS